MIYRKDIQILRGVAVSSVVAYHLDSSILPSGFLGVDAFFVISGFLMFLLFKPGNAVSFYARRAGRLLPAYFATIFAVILASSLLTLPHEHSSVAKQSIYSTFFLSNLGYWLDNSYFSDAEFKPLLHLWSLAVELQFYLILPILVWAFSKNRLFLPLTAVVSFIACFVMTEVSSKTSFFITPFRIWQFLLGGIVAVYWTDQGSVIHKNSILGYVAFIVIFATMLVEITPAASSILEGHPGVLALVVSCSITLLLAVGLPQFLTDSRVGTFLEKLGEYSYSIYLVHFPVFIFFLYEPFSGNRNSFSSFFDTLIALIFAGFGAVFLYKYVEKPFRNKFPRLKFMHIAGASISITVLALVSLEVQKSQYKLEDLSILEAFDDRAVYRCGKLARVLDPFAKSCLLTEDLPDPNKRILLVGNSHADAIKMAFAEVASANNSTLRIMVQNSTLGLGPFSPQNILKESIARNIDVIVLHDLSSAIDSKSIQELVKISQPKNISVSLIEPIPIWDNKVPEMLWQHKKLGMKVQNQSVEDYYESNKNLLSELGDIKSLNFKRHPTAEIFCTPICALTDLQGRPLYFDAHHLTLTGSRLMSEVFLNVVLDGASSNAN